MGFFSGTPRVQQAKVIWVLIGLGYLVTWSLPFWNTYTGVGIGTAEALAQVRDYSKFSWIGWFGAVVVLYLVVNEVQRGHMKTVLAATAFFLTDFFNEIWNALFYAKTGFAAVWQVSSPTSFQVLIGWNVEIMAAFFVTGLASVKLLPEDKELCYWGWLNNRHANAILFSALAVLAEFLLHHIGAIHWNYRWWQPEFPWLLFLIGYLPFYEVLFFVYDLPTLKSQLKVVSAMSIVLIAAFVILLCSGVI